MFITHKIFWVAAVAPVRALKKIYETEATERGKKIEKDKSSSKREKQILKYSKESLKEGNSTVYLLIIPSKVHCLNRPLITFSLCWKHEIYKLVFLILKKIKTFIVAALIALFQYFLTIQMYFVGIFIHIILLNTFLSIQDWI